MPEPIQDPDRPVPMTEALAELTTTCPVCGARRWPGDPILCRACGEPVLEGG